MKFLKFKLFAFVVALAALGSCDIGSDEDQVCSASVYAPATDVTGPETAIVNQEVSYSVKFNITNTCGSFINFAASSGFPKQIAPVVNYEGCECSNLTSTQVKNYVYTPTQVGTYEFKFLTGTNLYITKTLVVTEE